MKKLLIIFFIIVTFGSNLIFANETGHSEKITSLSNTYPYEIILYNPYNGIEVYYNNETDITGIAEKVKKVKFSKYTNESPDENWRIDKKNRIYFRYADSVDTVITICSNGYVYMDNIYTNQISRLIPPIAKAESLDDVKIIIDRLVVDSNIILEDINKTQDTINEVLMITNVNPKILNNREMFPMREIFEASGAEVTWLGETQTVTVEKDSTKSTFQINSNIMQEGEKVVDLGTPVILYNNKTLIPVKAISEVLKKQIIWDQHKKIIYVK